MLEKLVEREYCIHVPPTTPYIKLLKHRIVREHEQEVKEVDFVMKGHPTGAMNV